MSALFGIIILAGIIFLGFKAFAPVKIEKSKHPGSLGTIPSEKGKGDTVFTETGEQAQ